MMDAYEEMVVDADPVEAWRLHVLIEAGYPVARAEKIAVSEAGLHRACAPLDAGCRPDVAAEIIL